MLAASLPCTTKPSVISGMRVEPPSEAARRAQLASSPPALREAYISVNLCVILPSSVPCVSYGASGCKPFLGTYGAIRALCGTHKLLDSYPTVVICLDLCLGAAVVPEPLLKRLLPIERYVRGFGDAGTTLDIYKLAGNIHTV